MLRKPLILAVLTVALVTLACGIDIPVGNVTVSDPIIEEVDVPAPDISQDYVNLTLAFGAGELRLSPGGGDALLTGTATYNVMDFKPETHVTGNVVSYQQGNLNIRGVPNWNDDIQNEWDLLLGETTLRLRINAGAYNGDYELGGLSIQSLEISDGASDVNLSFSEPNLVEMDTFHYKTGASNVQLTGLANANFTLMSFTAGAGSYRLDFSGELQRDARVEIESGISSIEIVVPQGVSARLTFEGGLSNVDYDDDWRKKGDEYVQNGEGPTLTIQVKMGAGSLDLRNP